MSRSQFAFPIGYQDFHKKTGFNFQLNRFYSMGVARLEDMKEAGRNISSIEDWRTEMVRLAELALVDGRLMNAAMYFRAAEFYLLRSDPEKQLLYDRSIDLFNLAVKEAGIERFDVPYNGTFLPVLRVSPEGMVKRGTIVVHGGNDSFVEELYPLLGYFSGHGYEAIAFEGPGQGSALKKHGLVLDHEWEKPTRAVLDHFELSDVTLLGISMGGWLALRAAAFEPRIARVIAWSVSFDVLQYTNVMGRKIAKLMFRRCRNFVSNAMVRKMKKNHEYAWFVNNLMYITGRQVPIEAFDVLFQFSEENLRSDLVQQDVLILTGKDDHLVPFKMHDLQVRALSNAKSVTARVFTEEEHAGNHCQMGNVGLALGVIGKWIEEKS